MFGIFKKLFKQKKKVEKDSVVISDAMRIRFNTVMRCYLPCYHEQPPFSSSIYSLKFTSTIDSTFILIVPVINYTDENITNYCGYIYRFCTENHIWKTYYDFHDMVKDYYENIRKNLLPLIAKKEKIAIKLKKLQEDFD